MEKSMNIMRKLWVGGAGGGGGTNIGSMTGGGANGNQSISLGLMHLRKLFGEYMHAPSDDKIYNMLPLFCKVFGAAAASEMIERFPEINSFCQAVSKLMVSEVRRRAANPSTEAAAVSIVKYLEASNEAEEDSRGWTLTSTLNLLSAGEQNLVDVMTTASVPSTLVKCLYLFFDLPEIQPPEMTGPTSDFSPMERRLLLQKIFVQLLIRLSSYPAPAEELARKDDLALLFSAVTSWCPPHNAMWRKSAAEVLMTISTHGLTPPVLSYIHNKNCISLCVENLRRGGHLTPLEVTEMVLTLFCFLKDSADLSQVLLDDFKSAQGYQFLTEILIRLESDLTSESQEAIRNLVLVVASLTMCGYTPLKPNMANVNSLFSLPTFQMPPPGAKGCTVRNLQAFQVLQSVFSKSSSPFLSSVVLESISSVFKADHSNYFIVDSVLPQLAEKLIQKSSEVQQKYLELVEFVVFQLQFTPCKELIAISRVLKNDLNENCVLDNNGEAMGTESLLTSLCNNSSIAPEIENETHLKLMCVKMLLNLAKHNALFKDVFREVGILEVIVTCLHRFASDAQSQHHKTDPNAKLKEDLGSVVIELLTLLLAANNSNVTIFRENNGSKCALQLVTSCDVKRAQALGLVQQLLMSQGGEEDMTSVLVSLHSSDVISNIELKIEILSSLLNSFRDSHRARCNFRKAGGFLYLMSVLVSMEGLLLKDDVENNIIRNRMNLVQLIFNCFAFAMRFEPANAKLFHQEVCLPSLTDTLRLLGCFSRDHQVLPTPGAALPQDLQTEEILHTFQSIFLSSPSNIEPISFKAQIPYSLILTVFIYRLLYDLATDHFERSSMGISGAFRSPRKQASTDEGSTTGNSTPTSPAPSLASSSTAQATTKRGVGSLNLTPPIPEPVVIHSSVVIVMIRLIPSICSEGAMSGSSSNANMIVDAIEASKNDNGNVEGNNINEPTTEISLNTTTPLRSGDGMESLCQLFCAELVKSLVRNERNQQLMAQSGLTEEMLERCSAALSDEAHFLHQPIHYAFERVATHGLSPKDLRRFLRLGNPLNCDKSYSCMTNGVTQLVSVPLSRVKSLVSMTTPKSSNHHSSQSHSNNFYSNASTPFPPFVELDMSAEGFGCLFLPSVAPHNFPAGPEFGSASLLASGIGMGERCFPGTSGMSFSSWFCVDKFSDPRSDPHPVRILTIIKEAANNQRLCLCVAVSARDKAVLISTRETQLPPQGIGEWEPDVTPHSSVRVWCPDLLHEGQWHHLFLVFSPSTNNSFSLYVNGRSAHNSKLDYPHRSKGASYSAFIGTPPVWRKTSRLTWRQGVCHMFEDWVPNAQTVAAVWKLGPEYPGSWQAVKIQSDNAGTLISEDKIIFGLNCMAVSQLTLAKIRKIYSKSDAKAIAKQLGLSSHENATPISILHNSAAHLVGPGRSLGGVAIGYLGVRIFTPLPVSKSVLSVGGIPILIGLVAMATTGESLYAALKALVCVVKSNSVNGASSCTLVERSSWQMLGYLLKRKKPLLSMRVLHLVFGLVSTENTIRENRGGFGELLGDLDIWCTTTPKLDGCSGSSTPAFDQLKKQQGSDQQDSVSKFEFNNSDLEKALYEHFLQMVTEDPKFSLEILRESCIVPKLLRRLVQATVNQPSVFLLLGHLLSHKGNATSGDLITFGHFIVGTLPGDYSFKNGASGSRETILTDTIELRNKGLQLVHSLMYTGKVLNVGFCEELVSRLGFDFVLLFAAPRLHPTTLLWSLRILLLLLTSSPNLKTKFRDGHSSAFCFGRTTVYAQGSSGARNAAALLPLKKQDSRLAVDEDSSSGGGTGGSGGVTVASIAGGLAGKGAAGKMGIGGWVRLSWLIAQRCEDVKAEGTEIMPSEVWLILCAMALTQPCRNVSLKSNDGDQISLDAIWHYVFALPANRMTSSLYGKVTLCPDAIITLLTLIRCFITAESPNTPSQNNSNQGSNLNLPTQSPPPTSTSTNNFQSDVGSTLVQFLCYLYSHTPEFQSLFTSTDILSALAATVMPIEVNSFDSIADVLDCEEIKAFADTEPMVVVEQGESREGRSNRDSVEMGEEAEIFTKGTPSSESPKTPLKIGEVVPNYPGNSCSGSGENLMNHPAKKILLDFLRMIIIDWMSSSSTLPQSKTGANMNVVIDTVLEAGAPDSGEGLPGPILSSSGHGHSVGGLNGFSTPYSTVLLTQFHTGLLGTLLDHLIAFDLDRMTAYLPAVAHFISRLVDKLWLETFARDPQVVLDFILVLVNHCRTKRISPTTTDMIYNSLNRVVLFVLSRKSNKWDKVEALKKLRNVRSVIFGSGNHQQEFFGCLVHVLMQLVDGLPIALESATRTQWHVRVASTSDEDDYSGRDRREIREAAKLDSEICTTAERVWEDLFISKKPMVEDLFKITFPSPQPPGLSSLRDQIGDCANKLWLAYVASETSPGNKKSNNPAGLSQSWEIHQQLQSKLQKVTGGLTRLAGRSGIRKESEREKTIKDFVSQWNDAKRTQASGIKYVLNVKESLDAQEKFHMENLRHLHRYVRDTLLPQLEVELTRERGLWGSYNPSHLDKWMLDTTEGPCRMRKKLMKNDMFYVHYPYLEQLHGNSGSTGSVTSSPKARRVNPPISKDSKEFHKRFKHQQSLMSELCGTSVSSYDDVEDAAITGTTGSTSSDPVLSPKINSVQSSVDDTFNESDESADPDNQSMLFRLIGSNNEKISQVFRVAQIQGLDTAEGLLLFGKEDFYLVSGFTILAKTREIKDMYYLPVNMYEPILPPQCYGSGPSPAKPRSKTHTCLKFSYEDIREVHKRRYLLQPIALEIFCSDGRNYLLAYPRRVRDAVFQKFTSVSKNLSDSGTDAKQSVAGQRRSTSVEQSAGLFSSLIGDTTVTQRWVRGDISNFQYLMHLNTLAGRSYNDLMQYPVFPWILADYDSHYLDLHDPKNFRDLSKPMGAQSQNRLVQFVKRYKEWDDPHGETPPYHYGTHYSSAMIVCSYLVRMEPFAQHFLRLQGGHFDLADRMFHSIKEAWTSASKHNMADVKELIPEFFYLPEFLLNGNNFDLGSKQNGVSLNDVILPPWAKGDPREFIRVHRMALESDYVSQHLHEWIDLVFGYKQQGNAAVEAVNVFHHLFYEGNVDIYNIEDPLKKNATIGFINNFGQIPKQLFKKPHPMKRVVSNGSSSGIGLMKPYNLGILESATQNSLMALAATTGGSNNQGCSQEKVFFHHVDNLRPTMTPIKELKGPIGQILPLDRANLITAVEQNKYLLSQSRYISWGFADGSVRICHIDTDRPIFIWEQSQQHQWIGNIGEIVTCTASSDKVAITGSTNTVVSVWDIAERELRLKAHLFGHTEPITCLTCSPGYNIIVSGSKDLTCIIWDLARLSFVRQLVPHTAAIDAVGVNELNGDIATCDGSWLRLWSINGDPIGQIDTAGVGGGGGMTQGILCVNFSYLNEWDCENVIMTGSTDGIVRMWSMRYVQVTENEALINDKNPGCLPINQSLSEDSSLGSGSDSDAEVVVEEDTEAQTDVDVLLSEAVDEMEPEIELLNVEVFDPDKDRDSLEDVNEAVKTEKCAAEVEEGNICSGSPLPQVDNNVENHADKMKAVMRRQRALSSGTSTDTSRKKSSESSSVANAAAEAKKVKRKSDILTKGGDSHSHGGGTIRSSKSETSLSFDADESFEVLSEAEVDKLRMEERKLSHGSALLAAHQLREGHVWRRRITFRGKLTMHTAYDRKDNTEPASITAITVSRDHKNVYVGDARGRIYSWAVAESGAGRADHWVRDEVQDSCAACQTKFTITERKHHCRNCGLLFCSRCSRFESEIFRLRILRPVRVCQPCFVQLKGRLSSLPSTSSDM